MTFGVTFPWDLMPVPGFVLRFVGQILSPLQAFAHLNIRGQPGPDHGPGGDSYDQKPPEHPHDI